MIRLVDYTIIFAVFICLLLGDVKHCHGLSDVSSSSTKTTITTATKVSLSTRSSSSSSEIQQMTMIRGGDIPSERNDNTNQYYQQQEQESTIYNTAAALGSASPPNNNDYENGFANYYQPSSLSSVDPTTTNHNDPEHIYHETVQERVDRWRQTQMETYGQQITPEQEADPRDAQGRAKLLLTATKGARTVIFVALMWRDMLFFEMIDQSLKKKGLGRIIVRTVVTSLFLGNMAGAIGSLTGMTGHSAKKRFKAILNLDKFVEVCLLVWNFLRLTIIPSSSKYLPREVHMAGMVHCIFFLLQPKHY